MERLEEEFEKARAAFDAQMSGQKRIKCMMLLKKMKNSKAQAAFASWCEMVQMIQWERMEAEKAALMAELQARFGHMSAEEIERKMRQFMKRWINRKVIGPFRTWKGLLEAKKQAAMDAMMATEAARLAAELAGMQDNHSMKKLKMHFAKIAGLAKAQTFKALTISARQAKARKMLDGEAGKRLKAFLKSKLAGVLRRCYTAIIANHDNIAAENLKNNDKAKKVGMMLEKLARGMVHRIFTAFIRHFQECAEERAAQDAINARLSGLDEAKRIAAEAELAALLGASGDAGSELNDLQHQIDAENQAATDLFNKANADAADMRRLAKKIRECEADVKQEKE